jgi:hypothetical protein
MISLAELWMPIALSAVAVFIASSIVHMVLKWHNADYRAMPDEDAARAALAQQNLSPGLYCIPRAADMKAMGSPEMIAKYREGPVAHIMVMPNGVPNMGKYLAIWFFYSVVVSVFVAYLTGHTVAAGSDYLAVFRVAGTAAFMTYGLSATVDSIWKGAPWATTIKHIFDGLLYGLVTAGVFGWLWPR